MGGWGINWAFFEKYVNSELSILADRKADKEVSHEDYDSDVDRCA